MTPEPTNKREDGSGTTAAALLLPSVILSKPIRLAVPLKLTENAVPERWLQWQ
jgi:hypothetical protein